MIKSISPHSELKDIIKEYYFIEMALDSSPKEIPIVDDSCHDIIIFKEKKALLRYGSNEDVAKIDHKMFTVLGLESPYVLRVETNLTFFTIKFQPWMNNYFFGKIEPTGVTNLEDYNSSLTHIYQHLDQSSEIQELVKHANHLFLGMNIDFTQKMMFTKALCEFIMNKKGLIKVNDIASQFNKSRQYINKVFRQETMCSLKTFITSVRILSLVKQKSKSEELSLTQLAYDYGYFDQAHFINDFKKVCGVTPSYYFENLPEFILRHF